MEPFTTLFVDANGDLDDPNRVFSSIAASWDMVSNFKQYNSELSPEFFYMPEMFKNYNLNDFGVSQG